MTNKASPAPRQSLSVGETIASKIDLAAEVQRLVLVHERRTRKPLKRNTLARMIGVSASSLYAYLNGTTLPPTDTFDRLLDALDVPAPQRRRLSTARDVLDVHGKLPLVPDGQPVPRQLPSAVRHFVGRGIETHALARLLEHAVRTANTVAITAIDGTAGIGKTTLAVHWAHQVQNQFPDGQLYVNLRGFHSQAPMDPDHALDSFLSALGADPQAIPTDSQAKAAFYRTLLAGRRMLLVLDNARDTEQVRPLLPGSRSCVCLVTSRDQLAGLVAKEGVHHLTLDLLSVEDSIELVEQIVGHRQTAAERGAAAELVELCARLPLALSIAAARAAIQPHLSLSRLVEELRGARTRLDALNLGDADLNLRAMFAWSYLALTPDTARLFRLLGTHPGPDIDLHATAALAGISIAQARCALNELVRAHLLDEHRADRFRFHDLLRAYAAERAEYDEPGPHCRAALHRLLDHYLHTAYAAVGRLDPHWDPIALDQPQPGGSPRGFDDDEQASKWFVAEHANLVAALGHAAANGFDTHAWQLPFTLTTFFHRRGHWHDWAATQQIALAAANRLGDNTAQATTHCLFSAACTRLGRYDDARAHHERALALFREVGDRRGQAGAHYAFGWACERQGRYSEAATHARHALEHSHAAGNLAWEARALNMLGWCQSLGGQHHEALTHCQRALDLFRDLGDQDGQGHAQDSLGFAHFQLGQHDDAVAHYRQAAALRRDLGDHYNEAASSTRLGDAHHAVGDQRAAHSAWQRALAILEYLDHPDSQGVRARLGMLEPT